jgi:hypothetical protein
MTQELSFQQRVDKADLNKAELMRKEYGVANWLVSWHMVSDDKWLARVSCPQIDRTFEGMGRGREEAIHNATKKILNELNEKRKQEQETA